MSKHRDQGTTVDMVPSALRGGTKATAAAVGARYVTRPTRLNETGKLEWVYRDNVRHGAHDATPTIAEIAETEPCEKTTGWPATSCATRGDLRITSDDWASGYCLPCRIRAALDREQHRPVELYRPWPQAAVDVILDWILTERPHLRTLPDRIELVNTPDPADSDPVVRFRTHYSYGMRDFDEWLPRAVHRKAHYIATGVWL